MCKGGGINYFFDNPFLKGEVKRGSFIRVFVTVNSNIAYFTSQLASKKVIDFLVACSVDFASPKHRLFSDKQYFCTTTKLAFTGFSDISDVFKSETNLCYLF